METTICTAEQLKAMSREMGELYDEGFGNKDAGNVAKILWQARKAAMALEAGPLGAFEGAAKREIKTAVAMYETFKATL